MIQRKIRRAEREALYYEEGRSEPLLNKFYDLLLLTRRRHRLPPQPIRWFRHLIACLGDRLKIRVASKDGRHIAAIMTLQHGRTLTYKYGCSDADFHKLGAVPFLLWKTIQDAKAVGAQTLDLGRSDSDNAGLIAFKERWGATPSALTYVRLPARRLRRGQGPGAHVMQAAGLVLARMPARLSVTAGRLLYPHIG
jgi:lipid II:glycine glycyltransferase (peptidoglycan interpeptide bridge formation enzyme)